MANTISLPRSIDTISTARTNWNTSITSILQNFASAGQPSSIDLGDGTTGLQTGMLWYKAGSNTTAGQGLISIYNGSGFTRNGIAYLRFASMNNANIAITNSGISYGDLVVLADDANSRLYMVNRGNTALVDVGTPPIGYTVSNADLLDSLNSTQFVRSDAATTVTGEITSNKAIILTNASATTSSVGALELTGATGQIVMASGSNARMWYNQTTLAVMHNIYWNGTNWTYLNTGEGVQQSYSSGNSTIRVASSGTGGTTASFGPQYTITSSLHAMSGANLNVDAGTFFVDSVGNRVGVKTTTPAFDLQVVGTAAATTFNSTSDARLKKDIVQIENALDKIDKLSGYTFTLIDSDQKSIGVLAHELEAVYPELVYEDYNGYKSVSYGNLVALLIEGIKELRKELRNADSVK